MNTIFSFDSHASSSTTFWNICCGSCEFYGHNNERCRFERERTPEHKVACRQFRILFFLELVQDMYLIGRSSKNHIKQECVFVEGERADARTWAIWVLAFDLNVIREKVRDIRDICKDVCHLQNLPCESERFCRPKHEVLEVCFGFRSRSTHERIV
jgi:hypothetical protein